MKSASNAKKTNLTSALSVISKLRLSQIMDLTFVQHSKIVIALHQCVRDSLPAYEKHHLLAKKPEQLFAADGFTLGNFQGDKLAGFLVVRCAASLAEAQEKGLITCGNSTGLLTQNYQQGAVWVLQSVCVDPQMAGQGIFGALLEEVQNRAVAAGVVSLFAQASISNYDSWQAFLRRQFMIVTSWQGENDGKHRVLLQKPVVKHYALVQSVQTVVFPHKINAPISPECEQQVAMKLAGAIEAGLVGVSAEKQEQGFALRFAKLS